MKTPVLIFLILLITGAGIALLFKSTLIVDRGPPELSDEMKEVQQKINEATEMVDVDPKEEAEKQNEMEQDENTITIENFSFSPAVLTVPVGTTVTWVNKDLTGHTATADDNSFDTGLLTQNQTAQVTFATPGTYTYHCTPHPNMTATVVVE